MWQFLLTAVVAGSTCFVAKRFFAHQTSKCSYGEEVPTVDDANNSSHRQLEIPEAQNGVLGFIGGRDGPEEGVMGRGGSKNGDRVGEVPTVQCNGRRKCRLGFKKRRKTVNNISAKTAFLSFKRRNQTASALFDSGVRFGIKCMMVGKAEVSELTKTMNAMAKIVEELKSEIIIKKSPHSYQVLDFGLECSNMSDKDEEIMLKKTKSELSDTDSQFWCLPLMDNGECESSALTEDLDSLVPDMDQLEAELEFELQKLPGDSADTNFHEETRSKLYEVEVPNDSNFNSSEFHALSASELNQKLCQLQIEQQENQIAELESELYLARSKLQKKEAELQTLKNCVTLLIELPPSTVSGTSHGTKAHKGTTNWGYNTVDSKSEQSVGSDSDLYEHTKQVAGNAVLCSMDM